jgi:hypothetical protein
VKPSRQLAAAIADPETGEITPRPESRIRPGCEVPVISAGADAASSSTPQPPTGLVFLRPLPGFYSVVDIKAQGAQMNKSRWFFGDDNNDDDSL